MLNEIILAFVTLILFLLLGVSFIFLPRERWQFIAAVPVAKQGEGRWQGFNFTYYGFFNAIAVVSAAAAVMVLLGACGISPITVLWIILSILALCIPSARLVAGWVEKKRFTFSVGGASFIGVIGAPWIARLFCEAGSALHPIVVLAAVTVAYALGEGVGRLACISFGCCYGKPVDRLHPVLRRIMYRFSFSFHGSTRKAVYADGLEGVRLVPVQAMTSIVNCTAAVLGAYLFLKAHFAAAFLLSMLLTQSWRFLSEFLRADYRGKGRFSAYQWMALATIPYVVWVSRFFRIGGHPPVPDIAAGLSAVWTPAMLLFLQALFVAVFVHFGKSRVTGSSLQFHVIRDHL